MRNRIPHIMFILIVFLSACSVESNISSPSLKVKDLEFNGWFGHEKNSNHSYCLLGTGFFRAPSTDNIDSLISTWIEEHPNADLVPVYTFGPTMTDVSDSKQTYCWVVNGSDTLNIFLVRQGAVPGGTMQRPKTWDEMSDLEKKLNEDPPDEQIHISEGEYKDFLEKVRKADSFAQSNNLGLYALSKTEKQ